jgi:thiol-disulfide isomerase/thioredoxin
LPTATASNSGASRDDTRQTASDKETHGQILARQAGIGTALRIEGGKVFVAKVLPDTPAALSGTIKPNDQIVAIAEADKIPVVVTGEKELARVVGMIRGPVKSIVRLTIIPQGKNESDSVVVSLVRGNIKEIDQFVDGRLLPLGTKAPSFKFTRLSDSEETDSSRLAGRIVVIEFWASWCGPCIKAVDDSDSLQAKHPEWAGQVELLAVSVDEKKEDAATIVKNAHWTSVSIGWAGPAVLQQYRIAGLPTVFVLDRKGNVAAVDHRLDIASTVAPLLKSSAK